MNLRLSSADLDDMDEYQAAAYLENIQLEHEEQASLIAFKIIEFLAQAMEKK